MRKTKRYKKTFGGKRFSSLKKFLWIVPFAIFVPLLLGAAVFVYYAKDLPRPESFTELVLARPSKIYDRTGETLLYEIYGEERREYVSLGETPVHLRNAVIATEDANFYSHVGIDPKGVARAILVNLSLRSPSQGGSTLSQQLIRSSFLTQKKTLERKVQEIVLALELERRYSKDEILEFYLNQVPLGSNAYGAAAASRLYFQKHPSRLSLAESAVLAAMIRAPSYYSPFGSHKEELLLRKNYVISRMETLGLADAQTASLARLEELVFAESTETLRAPHFTLRVMDYLLEKYGEGFVRENGLRVYTSLDWKLQEEAEKAVARYAKSNQGYHGYNAALVAIDPKTGHILAMVGSKDWFADPFPKDCVPGVNCLFDPKVNVATRGRQPGSAFKPFAYVTAFAKGTADTVTVVDELTNFGVWGGKEYIPQNYDGKFRGPVTLRQSLAQSLNIPSIKVLLDFAGLRESIQTAREMGLSTIQDNPSLYGPSLVLGGGEVRLLDLVSAYGVFAARGQRTQPIDILRIEDSEGRVLEQKSPSPIRVIDPQYADMITDVLSDNEARTPIFGPASLLFFPDQKVSAKTGTTQDFRDGWIVGYTQNIVSGVWVGNNDNSPMSKEPGVVLAGPIWHDFMARALPYLENL
ncbi:MAG: transglycosylase domain-containing protein [Candidatus Wildermuthbacteria bacterium]|nr:transglycosylase domain-containing protein [Candidatus Wildermuthbacteria bacterium]